MIVTWHLKFNWKNIVKVSNTHFHFFISFHSICPQGKSKDGRKQQQWSRPTKMTKTSKDTHQQNLLLLLAGATRIAKNDSIQQSFIHHRYLDKHHKGNLLQQIWVPTQQPAESQCAITITRDWWTNCTYSSGKCWCHCSQWDLAKHSKTSICLQKLPNMVTSFFMWTNQLKQEGEVDHSCMSKIIWTQRKNVISH